MSFRTATATPGSHPITVWLEGLDSLPIDDESSLSVEVPAARPVLLVDGARGSEPFRGATDFLRAALVPTGDKTPQVRARVIGPGQLDAASMRGQTVVVLASVERLAPAQMAAFGQLLEAGGGVIVVPGCRSDDRAWNATGWLPARLDARFSEESARKSIAHPAPATFTGPLMSPFAHGDDPAPADADLFVYRRLIAAPGAAVLARLDKGDPWIIERPAVRGSVLLIAAGLDADSGTLPVNPDFVPMVHERVQHLADGRPSSVMTAGELLILPLHRPRPAGVESLPIETPDGSSAQASIVRSQEAIHARFNDTGETGIYRLQLADRPGGSVYHPADRPQPGARTKIHEITMCGPQAARTYDGLPALGPLAAQFAVGRRRQRKRLNTKYTRRKDGRENTSAFWSCVAKPPGPSRHSRDSFVRNDGPSVFVRVGGS